MNSSQLSLDLPIVKPEEWRPVVGYEGLYEVSDHGRVRSLDRDCVYRRAGRAWRARYRGKILKPRPDEKGRPKVQLYAYQSANDTPGSSPSCSCLYRHTANT